jgi:hypothetical protein
MVGSAPGSTPATPVLCGSGIDSALLEADPEGQMSTAACIAREAKRLVSTEGAALPRILRTYVAARAALSLALVLAPFLAALGGGQAVTGDGSITAVLGLCQPGLVCCGPGPARERATHDATPQRDHDCSARVSALCTIGVDLAFFSALQCAGAAGHAELRRAAGPAGADGRRADAPGWWRWPWPPGCRSMLLAAAWIQLAASHRT